MPANIEKKTIAAFLTLLSAALGYALTRYVLSGAVHPENIPLYIVNKAVSLTSVACLLIAALAYVKNDRSRSRTWGAFSFHAAAIHVLLSVMLLNENYFESLYYVWGTVDGSIVNVREHTERLKLTGELSLLFGVLGAYAYAMLFRAKQGTRAMAYLKLASTFCVGCHIFVMTVTTWAPWSWRSNFFLPPISLLGFLCVGVAFLIYLRMKDAKEA